MTSKEVLALPMPPNDAHAETMRDYLKLLLLTLWEKEERFSGKRPFGNSGWQWDAYRALIMGGAIPGRINDEYVIMDFDEEEASEIICEAIESL